MYGVLNIKKTFDVAKEFSKGVTEPVVLDLQTKDGRGLINTCGVPAPTGW